MERPDFREIDRLLKNLHNVSSDFSQMLQEEELWQDSVKQAAYTAAEKELERMLSQISVEELKRSRAGIRITALQEAGYTDLGAVSAAEDWRLETIDGIGEKQIQTIRSIITEFKKQMQSRLTIRMSPEDSSPENLGLITAIAGYLRSEQIRKDSSGMEEELQAAIREYDEKILIKSRLRWMFSSKAAKEQTVQALGDLLQFCRSPFYQRAAHLLELYRQAAQIDTQTALGDFSRNAAQYYAILENIAQMGRAKNLVYSSIPEELAAEINACEPDLSAFRGNLRSYQLFGTKYILTQKKVLLGDEMGLGKTVQAIAAMTDIYTKEPDSRFLIVCPASVLINWDREIRKFSPLKSVVLHGPYLDEQFEAWINEGGAAVTNYEAMGKLVGRINDHLRIALFVIDEAHYIKNPEAKRTQYIHMLEDESERILLMSGTPLENRVEEMCALIDFIRPDLSKEIRKYAYMNQIPEFREILAPVYLRRHRNEVLEELPKIEEKEEWCRMTSQDLDAYVQCVEERNFAKMRRVSFLQEELSESSKAARLLELCRDAMEDGRKIVVYSFFRETIKKVQELLKECCIGTITGSTAVSARQKLIDDFSESEPGSVLICQVQAGGVGLNIQTASMVIFCEPQIKPSLMTQSISRVHRMGQVRNVLVHHLLCEGTVDEAMMLLLQRKQREFEVYAEESAMAVATENLVDNDWIQDFMEKENQKYLPMVVADA